MLRAGYLRRLESLETHRRMDVRQLALCVEAMDRVKGLDMAQDIAEGQLWQAVTRRFSTLEQVSFENTDNDKCTAVQVILESCPLLKCLKVTGLQPSDLLNGKPWVCSDLRTLSVKMNFRDQDKDTIRNELRMILERLSKLEKLEHLELHECRDEPDTDDERLDLRLGSEVAKLPALKNLRHLYLSSRF